MNRRSFLSKLLTLGLISAGTALVESLYAPSSQAETLPGEPSPAPPSPEITVFRSPTCHCCGRWVEHMAAAGFRVQDQVTEDMTAVKQQYGVPDELATCHTAIAAGYVIEGHVPATAVQRLLAEQPDVVGIAVAGMPAGSPGMDFGPEREPYTVVSFDEAGNLAVFAHYPDLVTPGGLGAVKSSIGRL